MLAEPEDSEDTIDSREFYFVQIQVYVIVLFYDCDIVVAKVLLISPPIRVAHFLLVWFDPELFLAIRNKCRK